MPYTSIPTLSDGAILTASHLNLLAGNANFLGGLGGMPSLGFAVLNTSTGGSYYWQMRHRHRYLKIYVTHTNNPDYMRVYFNGTQVYDNGDPSGSATLSLDLNSLGLTVGTWYPVRIDLGFVAGSSTAINLIWQYPS